MSTWEQQRRARPCVERDGQNQRQCEEQSRRSLEQSGTLLVSVVIAGQNEVSPLSTSGLPRIITHDLGPGPVQGRAD
jgi:hypothetical protein